MIRNAYYWLLDRLYHYTKRLLFSHFMLVGSVIIADGEKVLLVKQNYGRKWWSVPGGIAERGESPDQTAIRETKEETGLDVRLKRMLGIYSWPDADCIVVLFEGEVMGGQLRPSHEITHCDYFPFDNLPHPMSERIQQQLQDFRANLPYTVY